MRVEIIDGVIPTAEIAAEIKAGSDGAVCVFDGIVRDNTRGRKTLYLDYEAYREMALEQMRGLAADAVTKYGVRDVALVHRLGRLMVGESSVLVVVASAHRGAAFDACRWLIDTLKKTVPIWKKEQFVDGVVWADGEPFPSDIARPKAPEAKAQSADGEAFPDDIGLPRTAGARAQLADGEPFPEALALGAKNGLATLDTPPFAKGAKDGAPASVAPAGTGSRVGSAEKERSGAEK
jgi:molybdopterin synthase catalytic subunit